jgi:hypothetical protein
MKERIVDFDPKFDQSNPDQAHDWVDFCDLMVKENAEHQITEDEAVEAQVDASASEEVVEAIQASFFETIA